MTKKRNYPKPLTPSWVTETPQPSAPPCTADENEHAHNLVWGVSNQLITVHQAHRCLNALFRGRELEEDQTVCACGIVMPYRDAVFSA